MIRPVIAQTLCLLVLLSAWGCSRSQRDGASSVADAGRLPGKVVPLTLDDKLAARLIELSLACVERAYPNKPGHVYDDPAQVRPHREFTPVFFGCFDWHSAVHGHWSLVRVLRLFPELPRAAAIRKRLADHLRPELVEREVEFFGQKRSRTFERPYGWGWLLRLAAELHLLPGEPARHWEAALQPLARLLARQLADYLERLSVPVREGTHQNTAYGMSHALDYARTVGDAKLEEVLLRRARDFYLADRDCPTAYEPSGEDFISPCLTEADLMRRVLEPQRFVAWLEKFLPPPESQNFAPLRRPVEVRDPRDPRIGHLIGLAWQRAGCFMGIAAALPPGHPWREKFLSLAARHQREALRQMFDAGYGGEHWLSSFALHALQPAGR